MSLELGFGRVWIRLFRLALVGGMLGVGVAHSAPDAPLPTSTSLARELAQARQRHEPLVVMVSLPNCPFCRISRQSHLNPMWKAGMPIVQVDMRSDAMTEDFDGKPVTHDQMARRWQIKVAPTLLFIGAGGKEVAERMQGTYLPDFYGPYLQERLQQARQGL
ncbi:MAG: hypothetical protein RLZ63_444 [Pseudomonadota bacterium]